MSTSVKDTAIRIRLHTVAQEFVSCQIDVSKVILHKQKGDRKQE